MKKIIVPSRDLVKPTRRKFLLGLAAFIAAPSIVRAQVLGSVGFLSRGQSKPYNSVPRINWSHFYAQNLSTYCYGLDGVIIDLVNGGLSTSVGMNGAQPTQFGRFLQFPLTGYAYMPPFLSGKTNQFGGQAPFSTLVGTIYNTGTIGPGHPGDLDSACVQVLDANNSMGTFAGFNAWAAGVQQTNAIISVEVGNTTNAFFTSGAFIVPNTFQTWGIAVDTNTSGKLYYNGQFNTTYSGTINSAPSSIGQVMYNTASINSGQTFGNGVSGAIPIFAVHSRVVSPLEYQLKYQDPYRMSVGDNLPFLIYPEDEMLATLVGGASAGVVGKWNKF
jgi:hypothetical protein